MIAQIVEILAVVAHPQFRQRFGIGERAFQHARHELGHSADDGQFVAGGDARVGGQRLFQQRRARAREADDENRLGDVGARRGAGQQSRSRLAMKKPFRRCRLLLRMICQIGAARISRSRRFPASKRRMPRRSGPPGPAAGPSPATRRTQRLLPRHAVEQRQRRRRVAHAPEHGRPQQGHARVAGMARLGAVEQGQWRRRGCGPPPPGAPGRAARAAVGRGGERFP